MQKGDKFECVKECRLSGKRLKLGAVITADDANINKIPTLLTLGRVKPVEAGAKAKASKKSE